MCMFKGHALQSVSPFRYLKSVSWEQKKKYIKHLKKIKYSYEQRAVRERSVLVYSIEYTRRSLQVISITDKLEYSREHSPPRPMNRALHEESTERCARKENPRARDLLFFFFFRKQHRRNKRKSHIAMLRLSRNRVFLTISPG